MRTSNGRGKRRHTKPGRLRSTALRRTKPTASPWQRVAYDEGRAMTVRKHFVNSLRALLAADEPADPRKNVRWLWLRVTAAEWSDANRRCTAAWARLMADVPDDLSDEELDTLDLPEPPEEAKVDALWERLNA